MFNEEQKNPMYHVETICDIIANLYWKQCKQSITSHN